MDLAITLFCDGILVVLVATLIGIYTTNKKILEVLQEMNARLYQINLYERANTRIIWSEKDYNDEPTIT